MNKAPCYGTGLGSTTGNPRLLWYLAASAHWGLAPVQTAQNHVDMWPPRSAGRPPAVTLSISPCPARRRGHSRACVVLTYILLSTIGSVEICVNQPPLWPTCLQPPPGWLSRSADLIKTEETISSDFHFFEPPACIPQIYPPLDHLWWRNVWHNIRKGGGRRSDCA